MHGMVAWQEVPFTYLLLSSTFCAGFARFHGATNRGLHAAALVFLLILGMRPSSSAIEIVLNFNSGQSETPAFNPSSASLQAIHNRRLGFGFAAERSGRSGAG